MIPDALASSADLTPRRAPQFKDILREVAIKHDVTVQQLRGPYLARRFSHPRQEAMYRGRMETALSLPQLARLLGGRDHTTILYGVRAHEARLAAQASQEAA